MVIGQVYGVQLVDKSILSTAIVKGIDVGRWCFVKNSQNTKKKKKKIFIKIFLTRLVSCVYTFYTVKVYILS